MLLTCLYLIGISAEAMTGALAAGRRKMDLFGVVIVAGATAVGGGSVRDILLGHHPLGWVSHPYYLIVVAFFAIATTLVAPLMHRLHQLFLLLDALGLIVFSIIGAQVALDMNMGMLIAIFSAVITGVFGGVLRDILCNTTPLIFRRELYASIAFLSAWLYVFLIQQGVPQNSVVIITLLSGFSARVLAIYFRLALPVFDYTHNTNRNR